MASKRLVLAFDASCSTCQRVSYMVAEACNGKLETLSLGDARVQQWRRQALGQQAEWKPTLLQLGADESVRAWTGWAMARPLLRRLGPADTVRVLRALGRLRYELHTESSAENMVSRGSFLRLGAGAVSGAVFGAAILNNKVAAAAPVRDAVPLRDSHAVPVVEQSATIAEALRVPDVSQVMDASTRDEVHRALSHIEQVPDAAAGVGAARIATQGTTPMGPNQPAWQGRFLITTQYQGTTESGGSIRTTAVVFPDKDVVLQIQENSPAVEGVTTRARVYAIDWHDESLRVVEESANGSRLQAPAMAAGQPACTGCGPYGGGTTLGLSCTSKSQVKCVLLTVGCATCGGSCTTVGPTCIGCVVSACGLALATCCGGKEEACISCGRPGPVP